jgi:UbiD family decarboxylase
MDRFRLRRLVEKLMDFDEIEFHDEPVALADLSSIIEATPKATLFRRAGPEHAEIVAAVSGGRRRLAVAFGVDDPGAIAREYVRRMNEPQPVVEVASSEAPVHEVVLTGKDIDLTKLPFHPQHEFDGGAYISSGIDYTVDPETGKNNVGCRRLMLRSRTTMRSNLSQPSDLKGIYLRCVARRERLPVSFAIGSHPLDYLAAGLRLPQDEFGLVATLRGEPIPMVRGVTNGVPAPADAEMVIEGYFDELGYRELEGPYGEFYGYYGPVHIDPVFHVTAITRRKDSLHQTVLHSGRYLSRTDSANLGSLNTEVACLRALRAIGIEPVAVRAVPATNGRQHVRVAIRQQARGQARPVISALLAIGGVKHVFVVDDDVDVFSDEQVEWAMATRFRADRDLVVNSGYPPFYMEPTVESEADTVTKAGFDLTKPFGKPDAITTRVPRAPSIKGPARFQTVREALASKPMYFAELMAAVGSRDGREVSLALDELRNEGVLARRDNGEWALETKESRPAE